MSNWWAVAAVAVCAVAAVLGAALPRLSVSYARWARHTYTVCRLDGCSATTETSRKFCSEEHADQWGWQHSGTLSPTERADVEANPPPPTSARKLVLAWAIIIGFVAVMVVLERMA